MCAICAISSIRFGIPIYRVRSSRTNNLYNHLRDTLTTQRLTADESLALDSREAVANCREEQEHTRRNQLRGRGRDAAQELDDGHDEVSGGAHPVGRDSANEGVELA